MRTFIIVVLTLGLALSAPAQPCYAENAGPDYAEDCYVDAAIVAIRMTAPAGLTIGAIEFFTGERTGTSTVGVRAHDPVNEQPGPVLGEGSFTMVSTNSWQGATLPTPVFIEAGGIYWVTWGTIQGCQCALETASAPGVVIGQVYMWTPYGVTNWNGPFQNAYRGWKFRLYCDGLPGFQINQAGASLSLDGLQSNGWVPAVTAVGPGIPVIVGYDGTSGMPWDEAFTLDNALVPGGLVTTGGQRVNIDVTSFSWLFGGSFTNSFVPMTPPWALPPTVTSVEAQLLVLDPAGPDGFWLSQAVMLR